MKFSVDFANAFTGVAFYPYSIEYTPLNPAVLDVCTLVAATPIASICFLLSAV
jgi:hypothetical protein